MPGEPSLAAFGGVSLRVVQPPWPRPLESGNGTRIGCLRIGHALSRSVE